MELCFQKLKCQKKLEFLVRVNHVTVEYVYDSYDLQAIINKLLYDVRIFEF